MEFYSGRTDVHFENTCITLGKFDGLHRGHRILLDKLKEYEAAGLKSVLFTFDYHPSNLFSDKEIDLITTNEEKRYFLEKDGPQAMLAYPFTVQTAAMEPEVFIKEILCGQLGARAIVVGEDYRFGRNRGGDVRMLAKYADTCGYKLTVCEKLRYKEQYISSTRIRDELWKGRIEAANEMLGYSYTFLGEVVHGNAIGRTIDTPTANLKLEKNKLLPPNGVYFTKTIIKGKPYAGLLNIGYRPTVSQSQKGTQPLTSFENYIMGYSGNLYGEKLAVSLLHFQRPEKRFDTMEELKAQISRDAAACRSFFIYLLYK